MNGGPIRPLACFEADTKPYREPGVRIRNASHNSGVLPLSMCAVSMSRDFRRQGKMSSRFLNADRRCGYRRDAGLSSQAFAQSDDADAEMRIQRLENQLRQLTGQNEELQYRNRQLEERLRQLGGAAAVAPAGQPPVAQPQPGRSLAWPRCSPTASQPQPQLPATAGPAGLSARSRATTSSRSQHPHRSCRSRPRRSRAGAAAAMPLTPTRIRTPPVRRVRSAAANCRSPMRRRSALPADAGRASRSISVRPARAIPAAPCRRRAVRVPAPR